MRKAPSRRITVPLSIGLREDVQHQLRILRRLAEAAGERHRGGQALLHLLRHAEEERRAEQAGCDRHHPDALARQLARGGQGQRRHPALRGGVGGLADLPLERRDRGRVDDHAALAVGQRLQPRHRRHGQAHHVERADQVDPDDPLEAGQRHRPVAADHPRRGRHAGTVDQHPHRPQRLDLRQRRLGRAGIGDVEREGMAADRAAAGPSAASSRSSIATTAPSATSASAVARPRPEAAPVTMAT